MATGQGSAALEALRAKVNEDAAATWPAILWCCSSPGAAGAAWRRPLYDPCAVMEAARLPAEKLLTREVAVAMLDAGLRQRVGGTGDTAEKFCKSLLVDLVVRALKPCLKGDAHGLKLFEQLCDSCWLEAVGAVRVRAGLYMVLRAEGRVEGAFLSLLQRSDFVPLPHVRTPEGLTSHQLKILRNVLRHLTCHGWACLLGPGGTGKTRVVRELARALGDAGGLQIALLAPTNRAVAVLVEALGDVENVYCATLHSFAMSSRDTEPGFVIVDEASMLCTEHARLLVETVGVAPLLLVGDEAQLPPVGLGEVLRPLALALTPRVEDFTLTENLRATGSVLAKDLVQLRRGRCEQLETHVEEHVTFDAVQAWAPSIVLALHHEDRKAYNAHCGRQLREGVRVRFQTNQYRPRACRGTLGTIEAVSSDRIAVRVRDFVVDVLEPAAELLEAHAITVHDAQGLQAPRVAVLFPRTSSPLLTLEMIYTAASRAEEDFRFFFHRDLTWREVSGLLKRQPLRCTALCLKLEDSRRKRSADF